VNDEVKMVYVIFKRCMGDRRVILYCVIGRDKAIERCKIMNDASDEHVYWYTPVYVYKS
jgi:hypothetical protein